MKEKEKNAEPEPIPKLEHMKMRWRMDTSHPTIVRIVTDESDPWHICLMDMGLPGDDDGEVAAKAIVDQHNAGLTKTAVNHVDALPEDEAGARHRTSVIRRTGLKVKAAKKKG
jgi:hypothetical protein